MGRKFEEKSGAPAGVDSKIQDTLIVPFELKSLHDDGEDFFIVEGYASVFGLIDTYDDRVQKGAFVDTIKNNPDGFPGFVMHDRWGLPVGLFFDLKEDDKGLFVKARLPKSDDVVKGRLVPQIKAGSVNALSIGFRALEMRFEMENEVQIRILEVIKLIEISFINMNMQADSEALLTGIKKNDKLTEKQNMVNAMVDVYRKGASPKVKNTIIEFYHEEGKTNPFANDSVISTEELKNLSKSNMTYAVRELKLSANASNYLAGLVLAPKSTETPDPDKPETEKDSDNPDSSLSSKDNNLDSDNNESEKSVSNSLDDLINTFKSKKEKSNV